MDADTHSSRETVDAVFTHRGGETLVIDGAEIYVEQTGNPNGLPVVFLHGGVGTMDDFASLLPHITPGYRLIGIDSRGHGRSSLGSVDLSYARLASDVQMVLQHLRIRRPTVIGFSDGGIVAYRLAASHAADFAKIVTIGARWTLSSQDRVFSILQRVTPESWSSKFPETRRVYEELNPEPQFDAFLRQVVRMWTDLGSTGHPGEDVRKIDVPILSIRGAKDHLLSEESMHELTLRVPQVKCVTIPEAGHEACKDQPQACAEAINAFLRG